MQSKLSLICDRIIEAGWLAAAVFTPLYFNVYSSRVFEPDKISMLRNIVLMMTVAWFIKLIEGRLGARTPQGRPPAVGGPSPLRRLFQVPMILAIALYAWMYLFSTLTSVGILTAIFGSYQRLQGLISVYTYIMLALMIIANMRSRAQMERLITFSIATSVPVAAYGLLQWSGHDPLPWAGDVQSRVASSMGNAIFVGAYLIMIVPLTLQRLIRLIAERSPQEAGAPVAPSTPADDPWPLAVIGSGAVLLLMLIQYAGMVTGNNIERLTPDYSALGDFLVWGLVLLAAAGFAWLAWSVAGRSSGRPATPGAILPLPIVGVVPIVGLLVLMLGIYVVGQVRVPDFLLWIVLPGAIFVFYALTFIFTLTGPPTRESRLIQIISLPLLLLLQVLVVFLTQSRGPELGLLAGLEVFACAILLRRRLYRAFGALLVVTVLAGAFLLVFNLPNSPIASWRNLPYIGRLGLLSQLDEGTGKVRTLIWGGAINLIKSDPVRMIIGWGPESMYVAYNKFYPPDLGHWELRNATPDRSHDVFFDQAVTLGLLGLVLYLFLIGSYVWYSVRALGKAPRLADQLLLIGFLSMIVTHIGELVTGIQIAATYTYFYIGVAGTVVLAYVLTDYLRPVATGAALADLDTATAAPDSVPAADAALASPGNGHEKAALAVPARASSVAGAASKANGRGGAVPAAKKEAVVITPAGGSSSRRPAAPYPAPGSGRMPPAGRAGSVRPNIRAMSLVGSYAADQPAALVAYAGLVLAGLLLIVGLNVNLVKADMFYKQGLAYDNAQQWPVSVYPYQKAIAISPNEDFYYLFLGRAYMEWGKRPQSFQGSPDAVTLLKDSESALLRAQSLNPLNTDHYANLGRLYIYWADAMNTPQQSAVQGTADQQATKYQQGIEQYEKAHTLSPGNAEIWNELALAYAKAGRFDDAMTAIRGSQQMDDRYDQTPFIAAEIERSQSETFAGQAQQPGTTAALSATLTLSATKAAQGAAQDYATAVKLTPGELQDSDFEKRIAFLQSQGVLGTLADGYRTVISQALQAKQQDANAGDEPVQARAALGYVEWKMGQTPDAIVQFERAVQLKCDDFFNLQNLGMLYQDSKQDEKALNMLQAALAVADCNPADPYVNSCQPLHESTAGGSCTPLAGQSNMAATLTSLRGAVQALKQKLGR